MSHYTSALCEKQILYLVSRVGKISWGEKGGKNFSLIDFSLDLKDLAFAVSGISWTEIHVDFRETSRSVRSPISPPLLSRRLTGAFCSLEIPIGFRP